MSGAGRRFGPRAQEILRSADFFGELRAALRKAGLVGEERNALTTYLVATSRLLDEPLNLLIKGPSSAGKNFLAQTVLGLMPQSEVKALTSSSNRSWNYLGKRLKHKVVYVEERNKDVGPIHPARLLMSEKKLIHVVTVRRRGRLVTKQRVTEGPIACISTTTKDQLEVDDETRNLSVWVDDSEEQSRRIMRAALNSSSGLSDKETAAWHSVQTLLARRSATLVDYPRWYEHLADRVEARDVRVRRYFRAFLRACKTVALIRSFSRNRERLCGRAAVRFSFTDFAITALILDPVFGGSLSRGESQQDETRRQVEFLVQRNKGKAVGALELAEHLSVSKDKAYALLREAEGGGSIVRANRPQRCNPKLYRPAPQRRFLPDPEEFFMTLDGRPTRVRFVHPLTGAIIRYERRSWRAG